MTHSTASLLQVHTLEKNTRHTMKYLLTVFFCVVLLFFFHCLLLLDVFYIINFIFSFTVHSCRMCVCHYVYYSTYLLTYWRRRLWGIGARAPLVFQQFTFFLPHFGAIEVKCLQDLRLRSTYDKRIIYETS